jgi:protocatechuate 3,4-dioxygenase alpha subunit
VTRIYFEDEAGNAEDPVLTLVADPARRATLLARRTDGNGAVYRFDLILQGEGETVFLDC